MTEEKKANTPKENLAYDLFCTGAILFGAFKLKYHETHPNAPLSPIYLNLRTSRHPKMPGLVTYNLLSDIAKQMKIILDALRIDGLRVCGIPHAGQPFASRIANQSGYTSQLYSNGYVQLIKSESTNGTRRIARAEPNFKKHNGGSNKIALIDDVLSKGGSKIESVHALISAGWQPVCSIVAVDRMEGGKEELQKIGIPTYAIFTLKELIDIIAIRGLITPIMYDRVMEYLNGNT